MYREDSCLFRFNNVVYQYGGIIKSNPVFYTDIIDIVDLNFQGRAICGFLPYMVGKCRLLQPKDSALPYILVSLSDVYGKPVFKVYRSKYCELTKSYRLCSFETEPIYSCDSDSESDLLRYKEKIMSELNDSYFDCSTI